MLLCRFRRSLVLCLVVAVVISFAPVLWAQEEGKININEAGIEELAQLQNIGPGYAERIVQYRQQNGPFEKPEDIMKVKGIGPKTWELNRDRIVVAAEQ